ncbi:MAG: hypothetical protein CVV05_00230 [Gammaproteobacteria bacterium HGW-Gammaproteobacteria-1]|jgi:hypothetical protein|nr:MAG: hypothetical protein CVV05_00230 [Gammaproteobacteria bacterium HGW-Gammaproteobacteria-1]
MKCWSPQVDGNICGAQAVAVDLPRHILVCETHRRRVETAQGPVAVGEICWFTKSMRMCRLIDIGRDGLLTLEIMDSGKQIAATADGIMPNTAFSASEDGEV